MSESPAVEFPGGAMRSKRRPLYHLVPKELMEAVADARVAGDRRYAPNNWQSGDREFFIDCLSHAIDHLMDCPWDEEESLETHLGHAATNIAFLLWALKRGKVCKADLQIAALIVGHAGLKFRCEPSSFQSEVTT